MEKKTEGDKIPLFLKVIVNVKLAIAILLVWILAFLISPLFVSPMFQFELFSEIITNWAGVIFPVVPSGLLIISILTKYYSPIRESFKDDFITRMEG